MDRTWMPMVAGILNIVAGSLSLLGSIFVGIASSIFVVSSYYGSNNMTVPAFIGVTAIFIVYFLISAVAIAGGVFALNRRIWGLSLAGSICSLFTGWAWPLGVAAIVLVILSRQEFDHTSSIPQPPAQI